VTARGDRRQRRTGRAARRRRSGLNGFRCQAPWCLAPDLRRQRLEVRAGPVVEGERRAGDARDAHRLLLEGGELDDLAEVGRLAVALDQLVALRARDERDVPVGRGGRWRAVRGRRRLAGRPELLVGVRERKTERLDRTAEALPALQVGV